MPACKLPAKPSSLTIWPGIDSTRLRISGPWVNAVILDLAATCPSYNNTAYGGHQKPTVYFFDRKPPRDLAVGSGDEKNAVHWCFRSNSCTVHFRSGSTPAMRKAGTLLSLKARQYRVGAHATTGEKPADLKVNTCSPVSVCQTWTPDSRKRLALFPVVGRGGTCRAHRVSGPGSEREAGRAHQHTFIASTSNVASVKRET